MADMDVAAGLVNTLEKTRAHLALLRAQAASDSAGGKQRTTIDSLDKKLLDAEWQLRNVLATGRGQDALRNPAKLVEKLMYLAGTLGNADYAPTESQRAVAKELHDQLMAVQAKVDGLMKGDVMEFHKGMGGAGNR
jgi:hypothetical protein